MKDKLQALISQRIRASVLSVVWLATLIGVAAAQYNHRPPDRITVSQRINFAAKRSSTIITKVIRLGTTHNYILRARAGQVMHAKLNVNNRTSFTIYTPTDRLWEADGVTEWRGTLPESGDYIIQVTTDDTTRYTLEARIE